MCKMLIFRILLRFASAIEYNSATSNKNRPIMRASAIFTKNTQFSIEIIYETTN